MTGSGLGAGFNETTTAIHAENVSFQYGQTTALSDVSLAVGQGSLTGLLGPNGSGKSTLFRLLATLLPLQQGRLSLCGLSVADSPARVRQHLGITFQSPAVDIRLTVEENLTCHGRLYGLATSKLRLRIDELLTMFSLQDRRKTLAGRLSGGLRRRVELAKALLHKPGILMLDEPSTGLDPAARRQFWDLVNAQRQNEGTTVLVTTHLMDEAEECDQLVLLDRGRVVRSGTPSELQSLLTGDRLTIRCRNAAGLRTELESLLNSVGKVTGTQVSYRVSDGAEMLKLAMQRFPDEILSAEVARPTLEDVFLELTGRALSEDASTEDSPSTSARVKR